MSHMAYCVACRRWLPNREFDPLEIKCRGHRAAVPLQRQFPQILGLSFMVPLSFMVQTMIEMPLGLRMTN